MNEAASFIRMIFRESKINDAAPWWAFAEVDLQQRRGKIVNCKMVCRQVLFFDECESIFESRDRSSQRDVNMLLTELERHDGPSST